MEEIKCNCGWQGTEDDLIEEPTNEGRNFSEYALCPKCRIDLS